VIRRDPRAGWPPEPDALWLVDGTMVGTMLGGRFESGESPEFLVALRIGAQRNLSDPRVDDDRTYVLDVEGLGGLIAGLMSAGRTAFGNAAMTATFADALGIDPYTRDHTVEVVTDALDGLDLRGPHDE
jgi:hypothetical protein